ncbi:MAG: hypothetical protein KGZ74_15270 [Chitinophagaceae bacterium]|nr:hypothetical protein [Chitinophagaceae bacterium]
MSNNLEQFIRENRSEFNDERPSRNVWDEIEAALPKAQPKAKVVSLGNVYKLMAAAAVVCILLTSAYFIYMRKDNVQTGTITQETKQDAIKLASPADASQMNQVFNAIQTRQQELKEATAGNPELYSKFLDDLKVLDSTYTMLQKQAAQTPNRDVIIKAMIQNLQLQAELLYRQLMITNEIKKENTPVNTSNNAELKG